MKAQQKAAKPLSRDARKRAIAQQTLWAVVDACTGFIVTSWTSRSDARMGRREMRKAAPGGTYVIERLNVRVLGVRS